MSQTGSNYRIIAERARYVVIEDMGPWDLFKSVTNVASEVVHELLPRLNGRQLYCIDSEGTMDQLVITDFKFAGFRPGGPAADQIMNRLIESGRI